jgi:hypothetical protein
MKKTIFGLLLVIGVASFSCEKEKEIDYHFKATVLYRGMDCGDTYLILLTNLSGDSTIISTIYYADNLSSDLKIDGLGIFLNCRYPENNELGVCTTYGPGYPHVFVIEAEKAE